MVELATEFGVPVLEYLDVTLLQLNGALDELCIRFIILVHFQCLISIRRLLN